MPLSHFLSKGNEIGILKVIFPYQPNTNWNICNDIGSKVQRNIVTITGDLINECMAKD